MQPVDQDLKFIESICTDLNDYILSDLLYWPLDTESYSGGASASRTTLGLMRLVVEQVRHKPMNEDQAERLTIAQVTIDKVHRKWQVAWEKKASLEFKTRLRLWQNFINEARLDPQILRTTYRNEVRNRTIMQLLLLDLSMAEAELILTLHKIDEWLNANLPKGPFIWDPEIQPAFPEEKFWFLYRDLGGSAQ